MTIYGAWQSPAITAATDNDLSSAVDLGRPYDFMQIILPTLDSCGVYAFVAQETGSTYQTLGSGVTTGTSTGGYSTTFKLGGYQFVKIATTAAQTSDRTFAVRGFRM